MSDDGEEFYKKRASWLQDMWDAEREELNACLKRSNEYFLEYCKERDALRAENETLRRDVKRAVMGDSAELQDVKRENEKLRAALKPFAVDSLMDDAPTLADYRAARKALESGDE